MGRWWGGAGCSPPRSLLIPQPPPPGEIPVQAVPPGGGGGVLTNEFFFFNELLFEWTRFAIFLFQGTTIWLLMLHRSCLVHACLLMSPHFVWIWMSFWSKICKCIRVRLMELISLCICFVLYCYVLRFHWVVLIYAYVWVPVLMELIGLDRTIA